MLNYKGEIVGMSLEDVLEIVLDSEMLNLILGEKE